MSPSVSIVIPAHNAGSELALCLQAIFAGSELPREVIVVDDGSTDDTAEKAAAFPVTVHRVRDRRGPAFARNVGATIALGDILLFLDADVCVQDDTVARIVGRFTNDPDLHALIGSYDNWPRCTEFISQYRNLLHAYVHQTGAERASTFWSGCGAIRRDLFREHSGFNECFGRPAIEDIELGYRLARARCKIALDRDVRVTHLKRWTLWSILRTDILDRGIPWTELILRDKFMPNDLNIHLSQRVSVALVFVLVALSCATAISSGYVLVPLFTIGFVLLARWWTEFANPQKPRAASLIFLATVATIVYFAWRQKMFGIIPPLMISPGLLLFRRRYATGGRWRKLPRPFGTVYICSSLCVAMFYLPASKLVFIYFGLLAVLGLMNSQFYLFLAGKRGVPFMLASIPFHFLYHFYSGLSFMIGTIRYSWTKLTKNVLA